MKRLFVIFEWAVIVMELTEF